MCVNYTFPANLCWTEKVQKSRKKQQGVYETDTEKIRQQEWMENIVLRPSTWEMSAVWYYSKEIFFFRIS